MKCSECGVENDPSRIICVNCGASLNYPVEYGWFAPQARMRAMMFEFKTYLVIFVLIISYSIWHSCRSKLHEEVKPLVTPVSERVK